MDSKEIPAGYARTGGSDVGCFIKHERTRDEALGVDQSLKCMDQKFSRSLNDAWDLGKQQLTEKKQSFTRFQDAATEDGSELYACDQNSDNMRHPANKLLQVLENRKCCSCRKRWQLAILANIGFMIVFGIRCNFGAAKNHMFKNYTDPWGGKHVHDFNWTRAELSVMESSFFYGYLITQVPAGFLAAKYPPNKLFGIAIGVASFLNLLLPRGFNSRNDTIVAVIQILQGLVQGVAYPSMHGVWRYWAPPLERSKLATTAFTGSYAGAVLGLPVSAFLVSYVSWSAPFYLYGLSYF
ncbi:putative vesicular glutamate transporter eat-4 [Parelaphostrongylus tenuis]|uniref:Vesicular glutamate transporter eat-4 n=1 Tax=Parelaphostrongylus tenuis TaxID=148309 RepID=A0AAD5M4L8_PARTN|nr:putative vesicular glutamate transporter eat-4 [Parelaphostrongylus tenuis]